MIRRLLLFCFFTLMAGALSAQNNLVIRNFQYQQYDQAANLKGTMKKDNNGKTAALLKIETNLDDLAFDGGSYGIVTTQHKTGQWWVYVPERAQKITIRHPKYGACEFYYPSEIKAARTYTMQLTLEGMDVALEASVAGSTIVVDDEEVGKTPQTVYLTYGIHHVTARNGNMYYDENINITKGGNSRYLLQMKDENELYGTVNITVADGADIYFDGKKVGIGSWYQRLKAGTYVVETRKLNCDSQTTSFKVEGKSDKTIEVKAPIPYTGSLTVLTTPKVVGMYSDTRLLSESGFAKLPVGKNEITYKHEGYRSITRTYDIQRDAEVNDTIKLKPLTYIKKSGIYAGVAFTYGGSTMGVTGTLGFSIANFDVQASYTMGMGESDPVFWYANETNVEQEVDTYKLNTISVKLGYQFALSMRVGLTPQIGYMSQTLSSSGEYGDGANCGSFTLGAKLLIAPVPHLCLMLNPEFAIPNKKSDTYKSIADVGGFAEGGFYAHAGIVVNF